MSWAFSHAAGQRPPLDFAAMPNLARAWPRRMELVLEPGETLYIPACCAHEIEGERPLPGGPPTHVLSVNRFWRTHPSLVRPHLPEDALEQYNLSLAFE